MKSPPVAASWHPALEGSAARFLFPDGSHEGLTLPQDELRSLSRGYCRVYKDVLEAVAAATERRAAIPAAAGKVLAREASMPILHFFLDRLIRLHRLAESLGGRPAVFKAQARAAKDLAEFRGLAQSSFQSNQALLARLAPVLGLPAEDPPASLEDPPAPAPAPSPVNFNLLGATFGQKVRRKVLAAGRKALSGLSRGGRPFPVLSMAYNTEAFKTAGFYGGMFENVQNRAVLADAPLDPSMREGLRSAALSQGRSIREFLASAGVSGEAALSAAVPALADFFAESYPRELLEAAPGNLESCMAVLRPFAPKAFLLSEANTLEPTFMMAAAKALAMPVVGIQYGGHHGYIEDHTPATEMFYPFFDRCVTWGWERMEDTASCRAIPAKALPSPWLSVRQGFWRDALASRTGSCAHDLLFMSHRFYRFPPAPSGASIARVDRVTEVSRTYRDLAAACSAAGLRVLHKPYNSAAAAFLCRAFADMAASGGAGYSLLEPSHKGMSPEIIKSCASVVWDQPGTGFIECLACGIPTLAFWPRIYNRESQEAAPFFADLEAAGIVVRDASGLVDSLKAIRSSSNAWMVDPKRRSAVSRFLRAYGWADPDWASSWRAFLKSLGS